MGSDASKLAPYQPKIQGPNLTDKEIHRHNLDVMRRASDAALDTIVMNFGSATAVGSGKNRHVVYSKPKPEMSVSWRPSSDSVLHASDFLPDSKGRFFGDGSAESDEDIRAYNRTVRGLTYANFPGLTYYVTGTNTVARHTGTRLTNGGFSGSWEFASMLPSEDHEAVTVGHDRFVPHDNGAVWMYKTPVLTTGFRPWTPLSYYRDDSRLTAMRANLTDPTGEQRKVTRSARTYKGPFEWTQNQPK